MKYLNLGCGAHYSVEDNWTNVDFVASSKEVIQCNLINGIPFPDQTFDLVYHSHVLEHFSKADAVVFLKECYRVLKNEGIIRIAIPDLEGIVRNYLAALEKTTENEDDPLLAANYDWMIIEMYDQAVRNSSGGEMVKYLSQTDLINEKFVLERIGYEGELIRQAFLKSKNQSRPAFQTVLSKIKSMVFNALPLIGNKFYKIGLFRCRGEIHQWMYDRYSLKRLLKDIGFSSITIKDAFTSSIENWTSYDLDSIGGKVRKPDSLFMEARK